MVGQPVHNEQVKDRARADALLRNAFSSDSLASDEQRWFYRFWCDHLRTHGCLPGRNAIDPLCLPTHLLPVLMLLDVEREGENLRFHYRLAGTVAAQFYPHDPTGRYFEDIYSGEYLNYVNQTYIRLVETRLPDYREMLLPWRTETALHYSRTAHPLAADGWDVDMVALVFHPVYRHAPAQQ